MNTLNTPNVNDTHEIVVMLRGGYVGSPNTKVEQFGIFYRVGEYKIPEDMDNLLSMHIDNAVEVDLTSGSITTTSFYFDSHFQICEDILDDVVGWASMLGYSVKNIPFTVELHQKLIDYRQEGC